MYCIRTLMTGLALLSTISAPASADTLTADGKRIKYGAASVPGHALFRFDDKGFRNTYQLDCANRRFLWVENRRLATNAVAGNNAQADWHAMSATSLKASAVYQAICPQLHAGAGSAPAASPPTPAAPSASAPDRPQVPVAITLQDVRSGRVTKGTPGLDWYAKGFVSEYKQQCGSLPLLAVPLHAEGTMDALKMLAEGLAIFVDPHSGPDMVGGAKDTISLLQSPDRDNIIVGSLANGFQARADVARVIAAYGCRSANADRIVAEVVAAVQ